MSAPATAETAQKEGVSFVFEPRFSSTSSGSSMLIWPADQFSISMNCKVVGASGEVLLEKLLVGSGSATNNELMGNFALAANRAADDLLAKLRVELSTNPILQ